LSVIKQTLCIFCKSPYKQDMSIAPLFNPRHVLLIGASHTPGKVGNIVAHNLAQQAEHLPCTFINPKGGVIAGIPCLKTLEDSMDAVDLAVIAVPPDQVLPLLPMLEKRGCTMLVCLTAGIEKTALLEACAQHHIRLIGPNCLGVQVPSIGLNASFAGEIALPGRVALVSQSGAVLTALSAWGRSHNIGFSHLLSLGDMADVDFADVLAYLSFDDRCDAIALYIEGIPAGLKFLHIAAALSQRKPILALKSGRFPAAAAAAKSHTGAMAGADPVYTAAFNKAGMMRAADYDAFCRGIQKLAANPQKIGKSALVLTNGGGFGVLRRMRWCRAAAALPRLARRQKACWINACLKHGQARTLWILSVMQMQRAIARLLKYCWHSQGLRMR
jgi:acetyltransferase